MTAPFDFQPIHTAMKRYVDGNLLAGVSCAVLRGQDLLDVHHVGLADKENGVPMRDDTIFRAFSNTKLVATIAALQLLDAGKFQLDDPIERFIPALGNRQVLREGATSLSDTEPATRPITIRQLMSHSSGLSYGLLDPGTLLFKAYAERQVLSPLLSLSHMMEALSGLPLASQPGTRWEYSVASDVLARLVEVVSRERFGDYLQAHILEPLGMVDTKFVVPAQDLPRLAAMYAGAAPTNPMAPGLTRADDWPYPKAFTVPVPSQSGGGGLVTTLPDMVALMRSLMPGGKALLKPETLALMMSNQLPEGVSIRFPTVGPVPGKVFGLGGAITVKPSAYDPPGGLGEFEWGGIGGTHWWINPRHNIAGLAMTQRQHGFWHPFSFEFKRLAYAALGH
ncbi:serine hydrolase domain-containing protein [Piscinibacter gummiphilus]|uniref:Serine hydrolase domain-containing protein n=1 Tax=Piscinibacter gummiphilus TaxID=946333 RepID=A0ABZ0CQR6_9BURK|nr:serine hydrolase domain-containing protein [Piscinibacter gummiphilus]WOB07324.1 serine hydrolase domain-containing protein [Piscinibacter gummiphilus]